MKRSKAKILTSARTESPVSPTGDSNVTALDDTSDPNYQHIHTAALLDNLTIDEARQLFNKFADRRSHASLLEAATALTRSGNQNEVLRILRDKLAILIELKRTNFASQLLHERAVKVATWLLGLQLTAFDSLKIDTTKLTQAVNGVHSSQPDTFTIESAWRRISSALSNQESFQEPPVEASGHSQGFPPLSQDQIGLLKILLRPGHYDRDDLALKLDDEGVGVDEKRITRAMNGAGGLKSLKLVTHSRNTGYSLTDEGRKLAVQFSS